MNHETSGKAAACILHASCVSYQTAAVLIVGTSGAGKSALALQLMALGAELVSDDKTCVRCRDGEVIATAPPTIKGLIEARGIGILMADTCAAAVVRLVVDLEHDEQDRLPPHRNYNLLGQTLPLLHNVKAAYFAAAILQYLKGGRSA
ncbi:HPr kinase/phosphorylase [Profundibacter sp.]